MDPDEQEDKDLQDQNNNQDNQDQQDNQEEQEVTNLADDPVLGDMISRLTGAEPKAPVVKPAEEDQEEEEKPKPDDQSKDDDDDEPLKVLKPAKSIHEQIQEELAKIEAKNPKGGNQPPVTPDQKSEDKPGEAPEIIIDGLSDDEQDYLDLLQYGAKKAGHQYADSLKKFIDFTKKRNELRDRILADDPDADLEDNDQLKNFTRKNMVVLPKKEIRAIQRQQVRDEVESELSKRYDDKINAVENRVKQSEITPIVEAESNQFSQALSKIAMNKEAFGGDETVPSILQAMSEKGVQAVSEENPLFAQIVTSSLQDASKAAKELVRLTRFGENGINVFKEEDPTHKFLVEFITQQDLVFSEKGGSKRIRDGKQFVTQQNWTQLSPEERANKWTFSMDDRLKHLQANAIMHMRKQVDGLRASLEKAGYTKKQIDKELGSQASKKDNTPSSPKVKATIPPGTASSEQPSKQQTVMSPEEIAALGLPQVSA